jgi:3-dehydroquinate dehydratase-1
VSLLAEDEGALRARLASIRAGVGFVEVRLDAIAPPVTAADVAGVVAHAPIDAVVTCRPVREGGRWAGPEDDRVEVLRAARDAGAAWVDVEWDTVGAVGGPRVLASRHWYDGCPADLAAQQHQLQREADGVKLAVTARDAAGVAAVLDVLGRATVPTVAIAMGDIGWVTRVLAPCFPSALLTYAAADAGAPTAPGQLTVDEFLDVYRLHLAGPHTAVRLHAGEPPVRARLAEANGEEPGAVLHVGVDHELARAIAPVLMAYLDDVRVQDGW